MKTIPKRGIHRRLPIELSENLIKRFWSKVDKRGEDECWEWQAGFRNGYGAIKVSYGVLGSHRLAYVLGKGEPPEGHVIMHSCDNKACCNPNHLISGTPGENIREAVERGLNSPVRGEMNPRAIFSDALVVAVWELRRVHGWGARKTEEFLGLDRGQLNKVFSGIRYPHLIPDWAYGKFNGKAFQR